MKNYILDTNVLLHDPNSLLSFQEHNVLLPIEVIEEIDRFKRESTELGQNARSVSRMLDGFRGSGRLSEGVVLPNGGSSASSSKRAPQPQTATRSSPTDSVDNRILSSPSASRRPSPKARRSWSARTSICASKPTPLGCWPRITRPTAF